MTDLQSPFGSASDSPSVGFPMDLTTLHALLNNQQKGSGSGLTSRHSHSSCQVPVTPTLRTDWGRGHARSMALTRRRVRYNNLLRATTASASSPPATMVLWNETGSIVGFLHCPAVLLAYARAYQTYRRSIGCRQWSRGCSTQSRCFSGSAPHMKSRPRTRFRLSRKKLEPTDA